MPEIASMRILDQNQIKQKTKRLAIEILEHNYDFDEIVVAGISNNGYGFAKMICRYMRPIATEKKITLARIHLDPANPLGSPISINKKEEDIRDKMLIVVDDVANSGRTLFYACRPFMEVLPAKLQVAVLVNRKHKTFPISVDFKGLELATTLQENIKVDILDVDELEVHLV